MDPQPKTICCCSARTGTLVIGWLLWLMAIVFFLGGNVLILDEHSSKFIVIFLIFDGLFHIYTAALLFWALFEQNAKLLTLWWRIQVFWLVILISISALKMAMQGFRPKEMISISVSIFIHTLIIWISRTHVQELQQQDLVSVFDAPSATIENAYKKDSEASLPSHELYSICSPAA